LRKEGAVAAAVRAITEIPCAVIGAPRS